MIEQVEYVVLWNGRAGDYLDASLNAAPASVVTSPRVWPVPVMQAATDPFTRVLRPMAPKLRYGQPSLRTVLKAALTTDWQVLWELLATAQIEPTRAAQGNAATSLLALWKRGECERQFQAVRRPGYRRAFEYRRLPGVSETT